jgi:hypothetical protein
MSFRVNFPTFRVLIPVLAGVLWMGSMGCSMANPDGFHDIV